MIFIATNNNLKNMLMYVDDACICFKSTLYIFFNIVVYNVVVIE